jgi:hypothetical protein
MNEAPKTATLDMAALTYDDLELMEDYLGGLPVNAAGEVDMGSLPKIRAAKVFLFLAVRSDMPDVTLEDVGKWAPGSTELLMVNEPPSKLDGGGS